MNERWDVQVDGRRLIIIGFIITGFVRSGFLQFDGARADHHHR